MLKKLIISIEVIIVLIGVTLMAFWVIDSGNKKSDILYKDLTILFDDDITCFEETFYFNKTGYMNILQLELQVNYKKSNNIEVLFDDIEIEHIGLAKPGKVYYRQENNNEIIIGDIQNNILEGDHKIVVKYHIDTPMIVTEYNNINLINIEYNDFVICKNITLKLPRETQGFNVSNNKISFRKSENNKFIIDAQEMRKDIKITVDKGSILCSNKVKEDYTEIEKEQEREKDIQNTVKVFVSLIVGLTLINIMVSYIFTKAKKYNKEYYRNTDEIIDVVFAESIMDKKINSNKLIMSVIVDQINCGNIIMDNDTLLLKKYDDESEIKKQIINMFFYEKNLITIQELSKVFTDNQKTEKIIRMFKEIRRKITKEFYNLGIYDKKKENILKIIRRVSTSFIFAIILLYIYILYGLKFTIISTIITCIVVLPIMLIAKKSDIIHKAPFLAIPIIYFGFIFIGTIIMNIKPIEAFSTKIVDILIASIIVIINYITIKISKKHIFTKKGLEEYKKVIGLNNYILDYSLIKERDMESVVIWDKYLVYATAFGIPNKVTAKFSEGLMNITEILDKINKMMINDD